MTPGYTSKEFKKQCENNDPVSKDFLFENDRFALW